MKKILLGTLLFALTLSVFHTYFRAGFPYTNDGENHLARFANYKIAIKEGQFPPRFAPNLMNHYGYPVFNFNYPLANILSLPLSFVKLNPEVSFKLISLLAFGTGLLGIYQLLRAKKSSLLTIVIGIAIFGVQPYLLNLVLYRGSIGELLAAALLPWVFWTIHHIISQKKLSIMSILIWSMFLLSHNVTVLISIPFIFLYMLTNLEKKQRMEQFTRLVLNGVLALGLSLWFWLPALTEVGETVTQSAGIANDFFGHFVSINQLLFGQMQFGFSYPGPIDTLSFQLGLLGVFVIFFAVVIAVRYWLANHTLSKYYFFALGSVCVVIFLQLPLSSLLWEILPSLQIIQFPWRLSILLGTLIPLLWAESAQYYSRPLKKLIIFCALVCVYVAAQLKPVDFFHHTQLDYDLFSQSTSTQNENRTKEFTYLDIGDWQPKPKIEGWGSVIVKDWTGSHRTYTLDIKAPSTIIEPTMNFLGWETIIYDHDGSGKFVKYIRNDHVQGRIAFELPPGDYTVYTRFSQHTWARLIGDGVSFAVASGLLLWLIKQQYFDKKNPFSQQKTLSLKQITSAVTMWWIALFVLSAVALTTIPFTHTYAYSQGEQSTLPAWISRWGNFDGGGYLIISDVGYKGWGLLQAYFPAYPILIHLLMPIDRLVLPFTNLSELDVRFLVSLVINLVCSIFFVVVLNAYLSDRFDLGKRSVVLLSFLFFPTTFFLHAIYTESLFLALLVCSLYSYQKRWWIRLTVSLIFLTATRLVGVFLVPALIVDLYINTTQISLLNPKSFFHFFIRHWLEIVSIFTGLFGLAAYMLYLHLTYSDPLYFLHVQSAFGAGRQENLVLFPQVVWRYIKILWTTRPVDWKYFAYVQEFLVTIITLIILGIGLFKHQVLKLTWAELLFSFGAFFLPTLTGTFSSMPRYVLVCLPLFIIMGQFFSQHKTAKICYMIIGLVFSCINIMLFIQGHWVA